MSQHNNSLVDNLSWLAEETERLAQQVKESRLRIAASARRRATDDQEARLAPLRDVPPAPGMGDRSPSTGSLAKWLPPLKKPPQRRSKSGIYPVLHDMSQLGSAPAQRAAAANRDEPAPDSQSKEKFSA